MTSGLNQEAMYGLRKEDFDTYDALGIMEESDIETIASKYKLSLSMKNTILDSVSKLKHEKTIVNKVKKENAANGLVKPEKPVNKVKKENTANGIVKSEKPVFKVKKENAMNGLVNPEKPVNTVKKENAMNGLVKPEKQVNKVKNENAMNGLIIQQCEETENQKVIIQQCEETENQKVSILKGNIPIHPILSRTFACKG